MKKNKISIIIPTRHGAEQLSKCLESIARVDYNEKFEIIVIDSRSTDNTRGVVLRFAEQNSERIDVSCISPEHQSCAIARNEGIKKSIGDYLFFTNDDCVVPRDWITRMLAGFEKHPDASAVGGWCQASKSVREENKYARALYRISRATHEGLENSEFSSRTGYQRNPSGIMPNVCYRREIFEEMGYFDASTKIPLDIDREFSMRAHYAGKELVYVPIFSELQKTMRLLGFLCAGFQYGQNDRYLQTRFKNYEPALSISGLFAYLSHIKRFNPKDHLFYDYLFLLMRYLGGKLERRESQAQYAPIESDAVTFERECLDTKTKELCTYFGHDSYRFSPEWMRQRNLAVKILSQAYVKPLISIIIPFYNRRAYINEQFVESMNNLECSDSAVELILVDDGSTDDTLEKLNACMEKLRFTSTILTKENGGVASARNLGFRNAQGDYIFMTDSDVIVPTYWLKEFLAAFLFEPSLVLVAGGQLNKPPLTIFDVWRNSLVETRTRAFITNSLFWETGLPCDPANMAIKNDHGFSFDEIYRILGYEDLDFVYNLKKQNKMVCYLPFFASNLRHMNISDFKMHIYTRGFSFKIFRNKNGDPRYDPNAYSIFSCLFSKKNIVLRLCEIALLVAMLEE